MFYVPINSNSRKKVSKTIADTVNTFFESSERNKEEYQSEQDKPRQTLVQLYKIHKDMTREAVGSNHQRTDDAAFAPERTVFEIVSFR